MGAGAGSIAGLDGVGLTCAPVCETRDIVVGRVWLVSTESAVEIRDLEMLDVVDGKDAAVVVADVDDDALGEEDTSCRCASEKVFAGTFVLDVNVIPTGLSTPAPEGLTASWA